MDIKNYTFKELIKAVVSSVKSESISDDYPFFLQQCKELGISSYSLNMIIQYANKHRNDKIQTGDFDKVLFVSDEKPKEEDGKTDETKKVGETGQDKTHSWIGLSVFLLLLSLAFIILFGKEVEKNHSLSREINIYTQQLLKANSEKETIVSAYENQLFKADTLFGVVLTAVNDIATENDLRFEDWTSTNKRHSSESHQTYSFSANDGDRLYYCYEVSSESGFDTLVLDIRQQGSEGCTKLEKASGEKRSQGSCSFLGSGEYLLEAKYYKDASVSERNDQAKVFNIYLRRSHETELGRIRSVVSSWNEIRR